MSRKHMFKFEFVVVKKCSSIEIIICTYFFSEFITDLISYSNTDCLIMNNQ